MANNNNNQKLKQQIEKRKALEEEQRQQQAKKKTKITIITIVAVVLVIGIALGVGIPLGLKNKKTYSSLSFSEFTVPNNSTDAKAMMADYDGKYFSMEGWLSSCTATQYFCLSKIAQSSCPYVGGSIPADSIIIMMEDGSNFNINDAGKYAKIKGKMVVKYSNALHLDESNKCYMYLLVEKMETAKSEF